MVDITLNELKTIIEKMEKENVESIRMDFCENEGIDFDIWEDKEYIKTIFTKKYWQIKISML